MDTAFLLTAFATMFVIIDPIGLAPMFVALTTGSAVAHRRAIALRACIIAAAVLAIFGLFGEGLLELVGISMPAFRIAGGVLLFLTALDMLFERQTERRQGQASAADDPSVFPLATPLIAGPGAMASMILLTGEAASVGNTVGVYLGHGCGRRSDLSAFSGRCAARETAGRYRDKRRYPASWYVACRVVCAVRN